MRKNITRAGLALGTLMTAMVVMASGAWAQVVDNDPTGGAAEDLKDDVGAWITNHGVPLLLAFVFTGIVVGLLVRYARRAARAA